MKPLQLNPSLIETSIRSLIIGLGEDPDREGLRDTPARVAAMFEKILSPGAEPLLTTFRGETYDNIVMVHHVPFFSYCEHHIVPFYGRFAIGYLPGKCIVGLSKLVRIFRFFARRLTIQERLTVQVTEKLMRALEPQGVMVLVEAEHLCMSLRGVRTPGALTTTSAARGVFLKNDVLRQQFIDIAAK